MTVPRLTAVAIALLVAFAIFAAYRGGQASKDDDLKRARQALATTQANAETLQRLAEDFGTLPHIAAREWNASQKVTFMLEGKPLVCVGLLRMSGDIQKLACDWDTWRSS